MNLNLYLTEFIKPALRQRLIEDLLPACRQRSGLSAVLIFRAS